MLSVGGHVRKMEATLVALEAGQQMLPSFLNSNLSRGYLSLLLQANQDHIIKKIKNLIVPNLRI